VVTAGQGGDSPQFAAVLGGIRVPRLGPGRPRSRPDRVLADKAYSSRANRALLRRALGYDQPIWTQYAKFMQRLLTGDLGTSTVKGTAIFSQRRTTRAELAVPAGIS